MAKSQNNIDKYKKLLFTGNAENTLAAIADIRKKGDVSIISLLFDLLATTSSELIKDAIIACIADIKDKHAAPIFIDALCERKYKTIKNSILQTMWQANIDFSEYAEVIIAIIIEDDFETVIEASTVFDTIIDSIDERKKSDYKNSLIEAAKKSESPKKELIENLVLSFDAPPFSIDSSEVI